MRRLGPLVPLAILAGGCFGSGNHTLKAHQAKPAKPQAMIVVTEKDGSPDPASITLPQAGVLPLPAVDQGKHRTRSG